MSKQRKRRPLSPDDYRPAEMLVESWMQTIQDATQQLADIYATFREFTLPLGQIITGVRHLPAPEQEGMNTSLIISRVLNLLQMTESTHDQLRSALRQYTAACFAIARAGGTILTKWELIQAQQAILLTDLVQFGVTNNLIPKLWAAVLKGEDAPELPDQAGGNQESKP